MSETGGAVPEVSYAKRETVQRDGETVYRAGAEGFSAQRPDGERIEIPWASIERLRLAYSPGRMARGRWALTVAAPAGIVTLDNMHFAGPGRMEPRHAAFAAFVTAVAERTAAAAPDAGQYLGASLLSYIAQFMLWLGGLALAGIAILAFAGPLGGWPLILILAFGLCAAVLPVLVPWTWRARPRRSGPEGFRQAVKREI